MRRGGLQAIYYIIPGIFLILSVLTFNSGQLILRWTGVGQQLTALLERVGTESVAEQWEAADRSAEEVRGLWGRTRSRVLVSYGVEEVEMFDEVLAELQGAVEARDAGQVQVVHRRVTAMWEDINP